MLSLISRIDKFGLTEKEISGRRKSAETKLLNGYEFDASCMNTPEANIKRKLSFSKIKHQEGNKNSQYGTMWITNGTENKKIKKDNPIPDGWNKGRKQIKFKKSGQQ